APAPRDAGYSFDAVSGRKPVAFRPCRALRWKLDLNGLPAVLKRDVDRAFAQVAAQTGMRFVYAGPTTVVPKRHRNSAADAGADLVFAFAEQGKRVNQTNLDLGQHGRIDTLGRGGFDRMWGAYALGGSVVIDAANVPDLSPTELQQLAMHELAHAVGLGHTAHAGEVMHDVLEHATAQWGPGDLRGLRAIGRQAGCLPRAGRPPLATAALAPGTRTELPPAPTGQRVDGAELRWDADATRQTAFYVVQAARTRYLDGAWTPWETGPVRTVLATAPLAYALPAGWEVAEDSFVSMVVRAVNARGVVSSTMRMPRSSR
ncbi:MAG: matrixin family metalloprotease, partial [Gaiellales bacterium]